MMPKSIEQLLEEDKQDENLQMCIRIRDKMNKRFKTVDALFDHLEKLSRADKKRAPRTKRSKSTTTTETKRAVPANASVSRKAAG